jgi:hypothetical protein
MTAFKVNPVAIVVAAVTAFAFSLAWYSPLLFGNIWTEAQGAEATQMAPWKLFVAPLRELFTAWFLAWLFGRLGVVDWKGAAGVGILLWLAFYVVQLAGAVIFDGMAPALGAVHAGDWLGKILIMSTIVTVWRRRDAAAA